MDVVAGSLDRTRVGSSGSFCDELLVSDVEDSSGSEGTSDLKSLPSADCSAGRLRSRGRVLRERVSRGSSLLSGGVAGVKVFSGICSGRESDGSTLKVFSSTEGGGIGSFG